ncbi:lipid II:glycine glycyltransferase FemX [Pseudonocardia bannensis]|uniref:Peptidoglycan bridge formation glycyltransferase FemA/FemB family protein n=1 Tax=Pseudonocardia bannensis TaxID=630973 RepID=A0A848DET0_9PSEU|nr:GNAT family N-acetyltransferase [Pseudonocardia bannensis]NMH91130.1 peptidoglycan bridge formation glycyltransferase FemA/FemB family protein [Pseudonocardia bannensis]
MPVSSEQDLSIEASPRPDPGKLIEWDRLVAETPGSDVTQLSGWATLRATTGYSPLYILATQRGRVLGGAQLLTRRIPVLGRIAYLPNGPIIDPSSPHPGDVLAKLCAALEAVGRHRVRMLFVQPPDGGQDVTIELLRHGFQYSEVGIAPSATLRIDLEKTEEELFRNANATLRRWTKRWAAHGVSVRQGDESDIPKLAELVHITAAHQGFKPFSSSYLCTMYQELAAAGHMVLFAGEVDGRTVAIDGLTGCGGVLHARLGGFDRSAEATRLNVTSAVQWRAIQWAKENGYRWFDLGGIKQATLHELLSGRPPNLDMMSGGDRFKVKFGGAPHRFPPAVELIASPILRRALERLRGSRAGRRTLERVKALARGGRIPRSPAP